MRYHFANCTDPLKEGKDNLAACGEVVISSRFALFADQEIISIDELRKTIGLCRDCRTEELPHRLVYVIFEGPQTEEVEGFPV
jgi:hypothetical protein